MACSLKGLRAGESIGLSKFNTTFRVVNTLGLLVLLSQFAHAQSVLNFPKLIHGGQSRTGISVTNPSPYYVDVQLTLYGPEGNLVSAGVVNPVRYRIGPTSQLSMMTDEFFAGGNIEGWVQATSSSSGLIGNYSVGDFSSTLEVSEGPVSMSSQWIPFLREDEVTDSSLVVINPGGSPAAATITFYNVRGEELGTVTRNLTGRAVARVSLSAVPLAVGAGNVSARVSASVPVVAVASVETADALLFVNGQPTDQSAATRIAPYFIRSGVLNSNLILSNPTLLSTTATVTLVNKSGGPVYQSQSGRSSIVVTLPANGSISLDTAAITRFPILPVVDGWLRIDSNNAPLAGVVVVDSEVASTAIPLETRAMTNMAYSQRADTATSFTGLVLVNDGAQAADVEVSLISSSGATFAVKKVEVPENSKFSVLIRDLFTGIGINSNGFVTLRSSVPIYGVEVLRGFENQFLATVMPRQAPAGFAPAGVVTQPTIINVEPRIIQEGTALRIIAANISGPASVLIGGRAVPLRAAAPFAGVYSAVVPSVEAGFVNIRLVSEDGESAPIELQVLPAASVPTKIVQGRAFYQKTEIGDAGLDLERTSMVPIRHARVEVVDRVLQTVLSVSETDAFGKFRVAAPAGQAVSIRVISRLRSIDLLVADNTNNSALYAISADIDMRDAPSNILLIDKTQVSGAFNILDAIQRGNDAVHLADKTIAPLPLTIFWSTRNVPQSGNIRAGAIGTTYFDLASGTAFVLGDRGTDSDEFDDSVILHEYAHMLAARFSRDDSPGGPHHMGDMLDPRMAWSEGFANFFSSVALNDRVYRDSNGSEGSRILRYDLEENIPAGDRPGYWSEASVQGLLWDLYDGAVDTGDDVRFPLGMIWQSFSDLRTDRYVYLPYFLDHFLERVPEAADVLRSMVQLRSIDFQPRVRPSVTNPFPRPIAPGETLTGEVDSLSAKRKNLMQSSHFLTFTTNGGPVAVRLDIVGAGPGGNVNANDLDLFLMDVNGRIVERSDRGLNGQSELISTELRPGTYVIEVRSYYTIAFVNTIVYNSGAYRIRVVGP